MCVYVIRPSTGAPKSSICGLVQAADALHRRCGWQTFSCKIGETEDGPFGREGPANFVDSVGIVFRHQGSAPNSRCGFFFGNISRLAIPTLPPRISHRNRPRSICLGLIHQDEAGWTTLHTVDVVLEYRNLKYNKIIIKKLVFYLFTCGDKEAKA